MPGASRTFARRRSWGRGALPCRALATRRRARRVAAQRCRSRASRASRPRGFVECARQRRGRGSRREQHCSTFRRLPVLWRGGEREREGSPRERVRSNASCVSKRRISSGTGWSEAVRRERRCNYLLFSLRIACRIAPTVWAAPRALSRSFGDLSARCSPRQPYHKRVRPKDLAENSNPKRNALYAKLRSRRIGHRISLIGLRLDFGSRESGGVKGSQPKFALPKRTSFVFSIIFLEDRGSAPQRCPSAVKPPSTYRVCPFTYALAGLHRNTAAPARSAGVELRAAIVRAASCRALGSSAKTEAVSSVWTKPGAIAFDVMPSYPCAGLYASARARVRPSTPDFAAAYGSEFGKARALCSDAVVTILRKGRARLPVSRQCVEAVSRQL